MYTIQYDKYLFIHSLLLYTNRNTYSGMSDQETSKICHSTHQLIMTAPPPSTITSQLHRECLHHLRIGVDGHCYIDTHIAQTYQMSQSGSQ